MTEAELQIERKTIDEPAKRWRNRYWFSREILLPECPAHPGGPFGPGILVSRFIWPSADAAETIALQCIERHPLGDYVAYLGPEAVLD